MNLSDLPKVVKRRAKRVGRGYGSGKGGHTTGRGTKGQKARGKVALGFEGTKIKKSLLKRLPFLRGKGKFKAWSERPEILKLADLTDWPEKTEVNIANLVKKGLVHDGVRRVKILGGGEVKTALTVSVEASAGAAAKITKAGGKILAS